MPTWFTLLGALLTTSPYDTVIHHAQLWTGDRTPTPAVVDAVALKGDRIVQLGRSEDLLRSCSRDCRSIDAEGGFVMPGFHDAHAHMTSGGSQGERVQVHGSQIAPIQRALAAFAKEHPEKAWILGRGWDAAGFGTRQPHRRDLDAVVSDRPVVLEDSDGHQAWANTAALLAAKIDRNTPDPKGGEIVRDASGEPTGLLLEDAEALVYDAAPEPTAQELERSILVAQDYALARGVTAFSGGPVSFATAEAYARIEARGELKMRAFLWADLTADEEGFSRWVAWEKARPSNSSVHLSAFKGFIDGVISSYTAAMLEPYSDRPDTTGDASMTQEELDTLVLRANQAGYPAAIHAIGDRGVRMALNAFEASMQKRGGHQDLVNRIEHVEALSPADAARFGQTHAAASMQPSHMHFDSSQSSYYPPRLGSRRVRYAFAWNTALEGGALLLFGSDWPVVDMDPIEGLTCAIQRRYGNGQPFFSEERVTPQIALEAFTLNPSRAVHWESKLGRLAPGQLADITVLPHDPRPARESSIDGNQPTWVLSGGQIVHRR